jgi:hypothetical protein
MVGSLGLGLSGFTLGRRWRTPVGCQALYLKEKSTAKGTGKKPILFGVERAWASRGQLIHDADPIRLVVTER